MSRVQCFVVERLSTKPGDLSEFRHPETGEIVPFSKLPDGALFEGGYHDHPSCAPNPARPDAHCWTVKLPCGTPWRIDAPASRDGAGYWTRQGQAPALTVTPSILISYDRPTYGDPADADRVTGYTTVTRYHGFLTNGWLESTPDSPC